MPRPGPEGPRHLVVHLPVFRLERCGFRPDELAALVAEQKSAARLVALTPAALAEGLRPSMTAAEARALCPEVVLEPWDEAGEATDRLALLEAFRRLSDQVAPLGEADLALEISRTAHLFGGEEGVMAEARALAGQLGHLCRLGLADDPVAARAVALTAAHDRRVPPGQGAEALRELPLWALEPSTGLREALAAVGIERVGAWAALDRAAVAGRFGEEGVRLHRVARGEPPPPRPAADEPLGPLVAATPLGGPTTTLEPILFALQGLVGQLAARLEARGRAAVRLVVRLGLDARGALRPVHAVRLRVGRPTRDPTLLLKLLRARLEAVRLEAPALDVAVEVEEDGPERAWQPALLDRGEGAEPLPDLLARLADALGDDAVFAPACLPAWQPEAAWRRRPFGAPAPAPPPDLRPGRRDPASAPWEHELPEPRPTLLLPRPEPIEVRAPQGRPLQVRLEAGWVPVSRAEGPERLAGGWWTPRPFDRTCWVVEVEGSVQWLFCEGGRWYLHGWFD